MASRYGSHLTQREGKSSLFSAYDERQRSASPSKNKPGSGYSSRYGGATEPQSAFGAYPSTPYSNGTPSTSAASQFRTATPDKKGRYSDAVLSELESQNDEHISGILGKVGQLKQMTIAIGDEIRDSSALAQQMNSGFEQTSLRLKGTMNRMLRMAEKTGVGWRVWLGFFAAVTVLFCTAAFDLQNWNLTDEINNSFLRTIARNTMFTSQRNMLGDLMPDIMAEDDFHQYIVKWVILRTFEDYQVQALCAFDNEAAWKAVEAQHTIARTCKKWLDAQEESAKQGRRQEPFTPDVRHALLEKRAPSDIPIVRAFMYDTSPTTASASEPEEWRRHLIYALWDPMVDVVIKCLELDEHIIESDFI
ncbi:hypothetical protein FKW77_007857 [Venturia effusa]|uniref:t-SNARE coiled-coil homology domain-containing protein n=1 Tax=Venturia effusa TaxID=50376 RepID=A0A517LBB2_9PEZI|nr:hypothetical protein FKW77_007857 [Venturia effusa]